MTIDFDNLLPQTGRLAIITGANAGLGFETARSFARTGMTVIMACRSEDRARQAMAIIDAETDGADLQFLQLDLSDLASVRNFAEKFRAQYDNLDLLVNNAGIMWTPYSQSVDGFENQMAANYFGHYLLTSLLLDLIPDAPEARIVSLSSIAHTQIKRIRFDDIHWEKHYNKMGAYAQTKLACLMFALELDKRLQQAGRSTLSVAAHPGVSETELGRNLKAWQLALMRHTVGPFITHSPDLAAKPQIMAALDPETTGGEYLGPQGFREMKGPPGRAKVMRWARDPEANSRLWDLSQDLTGAEWPL